MMPDDAPGVSGFPGGYFLRPVFTSRPLHDSNGELNMMTSLTLADEVQIHRRLIENVEHARLHRAG